MKILNLEQRSDEWLHFREGKISGSKAKEFGTPRTILKAEWLELAEKLKVEIPLNQKGQPKNLTIQELKELIGEAEVETVTNREQYEAPVVQSAPARPAVQSQTSKFRSLKAAAQEPAVSSAPEKAAPVQPAPTETAPAKTVQPQPAPNQNPSLSEMAEENKIDQMMGGDLSDIDDIQ